MQKIKNKSFWKCVSLTILLPSVKYSKWNRTWRFMAKITPYWKWNRWAILFLGHWPKKSSVVVELHSSNIEGRFFIGGVLVWSQQFRDLSAEKTVEKRSWPARFSPHFFLSLDHRPSNREWILTLITLERQTIMDWYVASFKPQSWRTKIDVLNKMSYFRHCEHQKEKNQFQKLLLVIQLIKPSST